MATEQFSQNREQTVKVQNGWMMLVLLIAYLICNIGLLITSIAAGTPRSGPVIWLFLPSLLLLAIWAICLNGFFTLQPNEARVLILFGKYRGTVRDSGFHWGNPFYSNGPRGIVVPSSGSSKDSSSATTISGFATLMMQSRKGLRRNKISLRARTLNGEKLKVNDRRGNPIEIAAVVVWRVQDTAQAVFDVDDYVKYVQTQSESALRHLASQYSYDHGEENEITLRSNSAEVSAGLKVELEERLSRAGVAVEEARLTHLAYAPEIAQAMLRRQQAEAVIAARQKIVQGAVSMVDLALKDLAEKHVVQLDDERKAAMVSNLMVVLCGESEVHPVVNTGTLYS
jgi:regulator of protease activity HflC (stomatin/prohibitin superfamily)